MNIAKSLKVKNRIINDLNKLQEIARRENSRRDDNPSTVNLEETFDLLGEAREKLVGLKAAIAEASAPISKELVKLAEIKSFLNWVPSLPVREGLEPVAYGHASEPKLYKWTAHINRQALDGWIFELQQEANNLQDSIDDFNAKTQVNWEG